MFFIEKLRVPLQSQPIHLREEYCLWFDRDFDGCVNIKVVLRPWGVSPRQHLMIDLKWVHHLVMQ